MGAASVPLHLSTMMNHLDGVLLSQRREQEREFLSRKTLSEQGTRICDFPPATKPFHIEPVGPGIFKMNEDGSPVLGEDGDLVFDTSARAVVAHLHYPDGDGSFHMLGTAIFGRQRTACIYQPEGIDLEGQWWTRYRYLDYEDNGLNTVELEVGDRHPLMILIEHFERT